jgi:hypothetical protein
MAAALLKSKHTRALHPSQQKFTVNPSIISQNQHTAINTSTVSSTFTLPQPSSPQALPPWPLEPAIEILHKQSQFNHDSQDSTNFTQSEPSSD